MPKGDRNKCDVCGLVVLVEDPCRCNSCGLVCCEVPMRKISRKAAPAKAKKM